MLPKEVGNLFNAVSGEGSSAIDANRLKDELTGMADFHRELLANDLFTPALGELYEKHVGKYTGQTNLTAPADGPPKVYFVKTGTTYGFTEFTARQAATVECPNCHLKFAP